MLLITSADSKLQHLACFSHQSYSMHGNYNEWDEDVSFAINDPPPPPSSEPRHETDLVDNICTVDLSVYYLLTGQSPWWFGLKRA